MLEHETNFNPTDTSKRNLYQHDTLDAPLSHRTPTKLSFPTYCFPRHHRTLVLQRAATRAKLVKNLRNAAQALAALQAKQQQEGVAPPQQAGGAMGMVSETGGIPPRQQPPLIGGDTAEAVALCVAIEQCLFHRIRVKDFGVIPFWAFLERVERLPLTMGEGGAGRPGPRERRLASVRNTVGAVASLSNVSTPLGRARAWIRQCLVCKCLESCVAALLEEDRLVKVFYEPTALARCREGSIILLRLCAALEAFDVAIDTDQSALDTPPRWPILEEEEEWDRLAEEESSGAAAAAAAASGTHARTASRSFDETTVAGGAMGRSAAAATARGPPAEHGSVSWFQEQRQRQREEEAAAAGRRSDVGGWAASALSEIDQLANGNWNEQLDDVLATVSSKVDKAVQSLDETINDIFGDNDDVDNDDNKAKANSSGGTRDGWVELRGGTAKSASALLHPEEAARDAAAAAAAAATGDEHLAPSSWRKMTAAGGPRAGAGGYPGAFVMGGRRGGAKGRGRVFGVPLEDLVLNPERCRRGTLDPALGVPDAVLSLIEALSEEGCRNSPGLFLREADETELVKVVKSLDKANTLPGRRGGGRSGDSSSSPAWLVSRLTGGGEGTAEEEKSGGKGALGVSPHAVANALVYFLHRLPEPLLTFRRREAFLACEAIPDLDARIRNVQLLVEDLPWAHKPLLLALANLCGTIAPPKNSLPPPPPERRRPAPKTSDDVNSAAFLTEGVTIIDETELEAAEEVGVIGGVAVRDAVEALAPALLRYPPPAVGGGGEGAGAAAGGARRLDWEEEIAAAAVVELIFSEQRRVLAGIRADQKRREERLSRKVERLEQLHKMLEASVYLKRPAHLAIVISIWRRLEGVEHEMLVEAAERGEDAVGLVPLPARDDKDGGGRSTRHDAAPAAAGDGGTRHSNKVPAAVDEDRDVRELETMLMGLEADEEDYDSVPFAEFTADGEAELAEACCVAAGEGAEKGETAPEPPPDVVGEGNRGSEATMSGANDGVDRGGGGGGGGDGRNTSPAFTIGEDADEGDVGGLQASTVTTTSPQPTASASDLESTQALLGSIADTLTPAAANGDEDPRSDAGRPLLATRSELALVHLMEEAEQEPGVLAGAGESGPPGPTSGSSPRSSGGGIDGAGDGGWSGRHRSRGGQSGFDDVLSVGSTAFGSSDAAWKGGVGSGSGGNPGHHDATKAGGGVGGSGAGSTDGSSATEISRKGAVQPAAAAASYAAGEAKTAAANLSESSMAAAGKSESAPPAASPVFSLGHERWITCGFTSAHTVGRREEEEASVGRALRDASSVLALDSMNYFLARYPRSAAKAVKSCARRHAISRGGGDSCPFPVHAGDITRVVATLLSLQQPSPASGEPAGADAKRGGGGAAAAPAESGDARALRLAALPSWRLLDAPNAVQEAFSCGVLVMEKAQAAGGVGGGGGGGGRSHHHMRYEESLLEMRRVLHACILHAPSSVEGFWAAAAVEGGVWPDPGDMIPSAPDVTGGANGDHKNHEPVALSKQLRRVLGLAELDLRPEDLPLLGGMATLGPTGAPSPGKKSASFGETSVDDRVDWSRGRSVSSSSGMDVAAVPATGSSSSSSDWLLAGETARAGMIESVAAENSGRPGGTRVVDDGVFQARLLCPSQILSAAEARALANHLPATVASSDWVSLYSNARHGASLKTLLARCAGWQPTYVVIEARVTGPPGSRSGDGKTSSSSSLPAGEAGGDSGIEGGVAAASKVEGPSVAVPGEEEKHAAAAEGTVVFGGFASGSPWKDMGRAFAGDGGCFLFAFDRNDASAGGETPIGMETPGAAGGGAALRVYPWVGSDRCFMTSDAAVGLGMGGGGDGGNFGFLLNADLGSGSTGPCGTFGNPGLAAPSGRGAAESSSSSGGVFEVVSVEVWGFQALKGRGDDDGLTRIAL
ncbi:unnamed protein product [Ectocarpus sp. CCAP 1310/34]|nr:unnamed protein product [Ectocarpus sp. CCAP 1310/34]